jgi:hypothetical protein
MPRRKYGHMVRPFSTIPKEKCSLCRFGKPCPVHKDVVNKPSELRKKQ